MHSTFTVFSWPFIESSIKDSKILILHLKLWYLGWNPPKFQIFHLIFIQIAHCLLIYQGYFWNFRNFEKIGIQKHTFDWILEHFQWNFADCLQNLSAQISLLHQMFVFFCDFMLVLLVHKILNKAFTVVNANY